MQAKLNVILHLGWFKNTDLISRGVYRISASISRNGKECNDCEEEPQQAVPCASAAEPSTTRGKCGEQWTPYTQFSTKQSTFGIDGHSYFSRAFFIMYKNEVVDLNEVVQFQLLVNLPSDTTPSSIMHCTLQLNLLHDKQKPATGRRKGVPTEVEHSWNLNVVSTAVYSLRVQAKGIHEMIPITFSSPYFVCLDGMINCALLYIVPSKLMNNAAVLGKEREIGNRNIPSPSVTMTTTTITDDDSLPSSKWKDCSQEYVDQSGIYTSAHMEMIVESLDSIVSALQWLLALEPIQPGKEDAFLNGLTFNDSMLNDIVILLRSMNSNLRFSSLIQYFKRGGASYFKRNSSPHSSSQPMQAQHGKGSLGDSLEENSFSYSPTETIENHICLISQLCFMEWNVFFVLLPSRRGQILDNLRCMWLFQSRRASESITLQHTSNAPYYFGVKTQDESFSTVLEYDFELNGAEFWRKQRRELDSVKGVKDGIGCEKLKNFVRIPELDCSPMFFCQRYISVPHPNVNISPNPKSPSISLDGIEQFCSLGTFFRSFKSPPPRPHVIVLQHGYRGTAKDMGLLANSIRIFVPEAHVFCPTVNEDKLHASLEEMGSNLAEAVVSYVEKHCPDIHAGCGGLSFVGFSAGSLVIRCMLQSEKLRPFHHTMHLFLSLSSPHLGVSTFAGGGLLMTSAIWGLRKWRKKTVLDELTQSDAGSPRDTLLYRLSDSPYLALFRYVVLVSVAKDQYIPMCSSRMQVSSRIVAQNDTVSNSQRKMATNLLGTIDPQHLYRIVVHPSSSELKKGKSNRILMSNATHLTILTSLDIVENLLCILFDLL